MALIDDLKQQRAEYDERYQRSMMDHAYFVGRLNDLDTAIAALEAPAQPLPSVEGVTVTPATEENSGGPTLERPWTLSSAFYDGYKCNQPIAPDHPVYMERWMAGDGERLKKLDEAVERAHAKLDEIDAQTCEPIDPHVSWEPPPPTEAEPDPIVDAGGYAPVTDDPASVLDDPELQAAVGRAQATLVDAELDAELDRVREQERAKAKHHFSIFGKLEDA